MCNNSLTIHEAKSRKRNKPRRSTEWQVGATQIHYSVQTIKLEVNESTIFYIEYEYRYRYRSLISNLLLVVCLDYIVLQNRCSKSASDVWYQSEIEHVTLHVIKSQLQAQVNTYYVLLRGGYQLSHSTKISERYMCLEAKLKTK
ncbi:Hypothetical_protein [Hexamita inflata]|nr:Hypothetical protein HINF_LOCUS33790 [Hexamita inflata]